MPFFGGVFMSATKGYPLAVRGAYIAALWHYWEDTHCEGMEDDDVRLQGICECKDDEWQSIKPVIFGKFFKLDNNGLWQQKRAIDEYKTALELLDKRVTAGKAGAAARWKR